MSATVIFRGGTCLLGANVRWHWGSSDWRVAYERVNARALTTDCRLAAGGALASPLIGFEPAARRRRRRRALRGRPRPDFKATTPHTRARSQCDGPARAAPASLDLWSIVQWRHRRFAYSDDAPRWRLLIISCNKTPTLFTYCISRILISAKINVGLLNVLLLFSFNWVIECDVFFRVFVPAKCCASRYPSVRRLA